MVNSFLYNSLAKRLILRPLLTEPDADELNNILSQNLQLVKAKKVNVPWKDLQNVSKTERKEFRKKYDNSPLGEENKEMRYSKLKNESSIEFN